jgi:hypothetical protein
MRPSFDVRSNRFGTCPLIVTGGSALLVGSMGALGGLWLLPVFEHRAKKRATR